jgi:peptidoglycan-associated lipoprotein
MRSKYLSQVIALALVACVGLTGCKNFRWPWQSKTATTGAGTTTGRGDTTPSAMAGTDIPGTQGRDLASANAQRPIVTDDKAQRGQFGVVYFEYNSAQVRPAEMTKVEAVANMLKSTTNKLRIEGHADERGTAEYNRALGEKRAKAVMAKLVLLGIDAGRIDTISYGKDKPVETGHSQESWAKNRRCEFVVYSQ